jgi:hypothetical protein
MAGVVFGLSGAVTGAMLGIGFVKPAATVGACVGLLAVAEQKEQVDVAVAKATRQPDHGGFVIQDLPRTGAWQGMAYGVPPVGLPAVAESKHELRYMLQPQLSGYAQAAVRSGAAYGVTAVALGGILGALCGAVFGAAAGAAK